MALKCYNTIIPTILKNASTNSAPTIIVPSAPSTRIKNKNSLAIKNAHTPYSAPYKAADKTVPTPNPEAMTAEITFSIA